MNRAAAEENQHRSSETTFNFAQDNQRTGELSTQISGLQLQVSGLERRLTNSQQQVAGLERQLTNSQQEIGALERRMATQADLMDGLLTKNGSNPFHIVEHVVTVALMTPCFLSRKRHWKKLCRSAKSRSKAFSLLNMIPTVVLGFKMLFPVYKCITERLRGVNPMWTEDPMKSNLVDLAALVTALGTLFVFLMICWYSALPW
jgi:hypothetical protein